MHGRVLIPVVVISAFLSAGCFGPSVTTTDPVALLPTVEDLPNGWVVDTEGPLSENSSEFRAGYTRSFEWDDETDLYTLDVDVLTFNTTKAAQRFYAEESRLVDPPMSSSSVGDEAVLHETRSYTELVAVGGNVFTWVYLDNSFGNEDAPVDLEEIARGIFRRA